MSGIKEITSIKKQYTKAIVVFHEDLDGVASAIAMIHYLKQYDIETIDVDQIQYGEKEFNLKKRKLDDDTMLVLVDFAHGKPEFTIHTDHHMKQIGHTDTKATSFLKAPSNAETLSGIISNPLFPAEDMRMISIIDSARFYENNIKPKDVIKYVYEFDKLKKYGVNKQNMALVTNKLILAYKTRNNFMKELVLSSSPSILSIYQNINRIAKKYGYWMDGRYKSAPPEGLKENSDRYIKGIKKYHDKKVSDCGNILIQFDAGNDKENGVSATIAGAYDRYVGFLNHPNVYFQVLAWSFGTIQISCNPFKKRIFEDIDLSIITQKVLDRHKTELESIDITLKDLKKNMEGNKAKRYNPDDDSIGFRWIDLISRFDKSKLKSEIDLSDIDSDPWKQNIIKVLDKPYATLSFGEKEMLKNISLNLWEIVQAQTGGHKSMYNLSLGNFAADSNVMLRQFQMEIVEELQLMIKNK